MATVRGTFDLNSRPASSALRDIRTEGEKTDAVMQRVGQSMDGIGTTKQREQVRLYNQALKSLGRQWEQTATKADVSWSQMEKKTLDAVATQNAAIDDLQGKVNELGRSSPTISVNTRGVAESIAEVELLQRRLNELGRSRPTARVGVGGTASSLAQTAGSGGGGRGGFRVPGLGAVPLPLIGAAIGAAPPLLGGATALLGSAGSATLGAGALGVAGFGALAAGVGSIASVAIPAVKGLKESYKALTAYNKAVAQNGKNSSQAHTALEKLNAALQSAPEGTAGLLNQEQRLSSRFKSMTKPGQSSFIGSLTNLLGAGNKLTPQLAGIANPLLAAGQRQSGRLGGFLTGSTTRSFLGASGNTAISVLPDVESTFQHVLGTLMNISHAAMPFFRQSVAWLESWTQGWATSTGNIDKTRRSIGGMVSNLKSWGRLTGATFTLLKDLFSAGTRPGQSLVDDLTQQLNTWDAWIKRNPRQVREFFRNSVESTEKIAGALGKITGLIWKLGQLITPLLTQLSQFVGFLDSAGLLTPGALPLLLASGAGVRNVIGSARGRILGTSGAAGGGSLSEGLLLGGAMGGGGGVRGPGMFSRAGGFLSRVKSMGYVPVAGAGGSLAAEADAGLIGATRFSAGRAARYAGSEALGGLRSAGGTFLRGAGARLLPIAALMGGLSAASFPGDLRSRVQAGVSSFSLGLVKAPKTEAEQEDEASRHAQLVADYYAERYGGNLHGIRQQLRATARKRNRLLTPAPPGGLKGFIQRPFGAGSILGKDLGQANTMEVSADARKEAEALAKNQEQLKAAYRQQAIERGGTLGTQFGAAFNIRKQHGAVKGLEDLTTPILRKIKELGPAGGRVLGQNVLSWAREAKRKNPKLTEAYETLVNRIEGKFQRMGQNIEIINGQIYTGSSKEWKAIAGAMSNPIEQAREEMSQAFTAIQRQAIGSLTAMGFSRSQAKTLVRESEKGGETGRIAKANMETGPVLGGNAFTTPREKKQSGYHGGPSFNTGHALGGRLGRIPGYGNTDHVPLGDGSLGAPNELIVNPHTEGKANRLLSAFGITLEQLQRGEKYRASTPVGQMYTRPGGRARGGRMPGGSSWRGIGPAGLHQGVKAVASAVLGKFPGLSVTSTTGGAHVPGSLHYLGEAVDVAGSTDIMHAASEWIKKSGLYRQLTEGIHNPNLSVSDGHMVDPSFYAAVWAEHANHIHLGVAHAVGKLLGLSGGGKGGGLGGRRLHLKAPRSGLGGVPGALVNAGNSAFARGLEGKINKRMGGLGAGRGGDNAAGGLNAWLTRALKITRHYSAANLTALRGRAMQESGGNPKAINNWDSNAAAGHPSQGLLQTIPETFASYKLPGYGNILNPIDNAIAAIRYMYARYGHIVGPGSGGYSRGGRMPSWGGWNAKGGSFTASRPTLFGVGEGLGKEDVEVRPHRPPGRLGSPHRRGRGPVEVNFKGAHFHVRKDGDIDAIANAVGAKLAEALHEDDGVDEEELVG